MMDAVTSKSEPDVEFNHLVEQLRSGRPLNAKSVEFIETHLSCIFLTERHAYKLMKRVHWDFVDYRTLAARREGCLAELSVNRRTAPDVYLKVEPITYYRNKARVSGEGHVVDYLVKMKRLDETTCLKTLLEEDRLEDKQLDALAMFLTDFYTTLPPETVRAAEYLRHLYRHIEDNHDELCRAEHGLPDALVRRVFAQQTRALRRLELTIQQRISEGRIVDGHGDLRPEHIYFTPSPIAIDAIEFNAEFRQIDAADELAFLAMECEVLGHPAVGQQILATYEQASGDVVAPALLAFYKSYRATVRAKVAALRAKNARPAQQANDLLSAEDYLQRAKDYLPPLPRLIIMRGLMGSGKTTIAGMVARVLEGVRLRSDVIRHDSFGDSTENTEYGSQNYSEKARDHIYEEMLLQSETLLATGKNVVLDATFISAAWIERAIETAHLLRAQPLVIDCVCPPTLAKKRIADRKGDASEARTDLYDQQRRDQEPIPPDVEVIRLDTSAEMDDLTKRIESLKLEV